MVWSSDVTDPEIHRLIRDDPQQGYTLLLQQYGGRIQGYLRQRFPSLDDSDLFDAMTDAMLALAESYDPERGSLPAWFLLLAHQKAIAVLRSVRRRPLSGAMEAVSEPPDPGGDPLSQAQTRERLDELRAAIADLPSLERAVLEADLEEGRAVAAELLAPRLGTTPGSVYSARRRARKRLMERCGWVRTWLQTGRTNDDET